MKKLDGAACDEFVVAIKYLSDKELVSHPKHCFWNDFREFVGSEYRTILDASYHNVTDFAPAVILKIADDNSSLSSALSDRAASPHRAALNLYYGLRPSGGASPDHASRIFFWMLVNFPNHRSTVAIESKVFRGQNFSSFFRFSLPLDGSEAREKYLSYIDSIASKPNKETEASNRYPEKLHLQDEEVVSLKCIASSSIEDSLFSFRLDNVGSQNVSAEQLDVTAGFTVRKFYTIEGYGLAWRRVRLSIDTAGTSSPNFELNRELKSPYEVRNANLILTGGLPPGWVLSSNVGTLDGDYLLVETSILKLTPKDVGEVVGSMTANLLDESLVYSDGAEILPKNKEIIVQRLVSKQSFPDANKLSGDIVVASQTYSVELEAGTGHG